MLFGLVSRHYISFSILSTLSMVKFLRQHRTNEVPVTGTISPRYIHQFPYKSIRVIAKGSAVLPSRKSAEPFSSYKVIFQHPQAIRAIRHIRIARTPRLLSSCYQTGNPVLKKCVFSRFCSPSGIIPTRCRNLYLKRFCLEIFCSCSSDYFDYPYYLSYTMDAYQNLISSDKLRRAVRESRFGWLSTRTHIL